MTLKELYKVSPQAFIFVAEYGEDKTAYREYCGSGPDGEREVFRVLPRRFPMYTNTLVVELV